MKKGFTLAEVLITLAIIGVVAALTIPVVVHKYQSKQFYTHFMKVFNTMSNALQLAQAENGNCTGWGTDAYGKSHAFNNEAYEKNLFPYLRIQRVCASANDCGISNSLTVKLLNSQTEQSYSSAIEFDNSYYIDPVILNDGSIIQIGLDGNHISDITFDTNGLKGPNVMGRDIFNLPAMRREDGVCVLGTNNSWYTPERIEEGCSTAQESTGSTCSLKLLREGKMNY